MGGGSGRALPTGTVTFLFSDIEGSTKLLQELGEAYEPTLAEHRRLLREAFGDHNGHEVGTEGDGFFVVFERASDAVAAALKCQLSLGSHQWPDRPVRVRIGVHTGEAQLVDEDYVGLAVHQAARVSAAAHGGQVLVSQTTRDLATGSMPDGSTLVDLGEHRLKDLAQPTRLYNLAHAGLQAELPPPRTLSVLPNNLPLQLTTFIGRDTELARIVKLLETNRLVSLIGAGGSGKTRLALQVAADLVADFRDGAWLADLSTITDPELVLRGFAEAMGVREEKDRPIEDVLIEHLQGKELLVIVDNCEHLAEESAATVDRLLHAATGLRIIATSREPLGADGETVFRVPSLGTPKGVEPAEELSNYESVRLFCDRASRAVGDFSLDSGNARAVAEICERLDGMPLAIELAAARVRMLTPQEIAKRLDDRFKLLTGGLRTGIRRQQTLRAAVDWSYDMLSEAERLLFRRLSAFVGGFTLEAAEGICSGAAIAEFDVFDLLSALVDRSLVVAEPHDGTTRYRLLETMREYGRETLAASGESAVVWSRQLSWFAVLAEGAVDGLEGAEESAWLARLDDEHDNIRQSLSWATADGDPVDGLRLATSLYRYWQIRWHVAEGYRWVKALLDVAGDLPLPLRAKSMMAAGSLASNSGKPAEGRPHYEACSQLEVTPETSRWVAEATNDLGIVIWTVDGDVERARELLRRALEIRQQSGHRPGIAESLNNLGSIAAWQGDYTEGRKLIAQAVEIRRELGAKTHVAHGLSQLAGLATYDLEMQEAERLQSEALVIRREQGDHQGINSSLNALGQLAAQRGEYALASSLHDEALEVSQSREDPFAILETTYHIASIALEQGRYADARQLMERSLERSAEIESVIGRAFCIEGLARLERIEGNTRRARELLDEIAPTFRSFAASQLTPLLARRALTARDEGMLDEALVFVAEALTLSDTQKIEVYVALAAYAAGLIDLSRSRLDEAATHFRRALEIRSRAGFRAAVEISMRALGWVAAAQDDGDRAARLLGAAEALREQLGTVIHPVERADQDAAVAKATAAVGPDTFEATWIEGRSMTLDDAVALALS